MPPYDFEKFFNLSLDMLCIAGTDGYFKRVNASFPRLLGWTTDELISRPFIDFVHPDDISQTLGEVEKLSSGLPTEGFQNRYRCTDGNYKQLLWTAFPEPETGLLFAAARDMTKMVETNHRFQLVIDASPVALVIVDQHGKIRLVNRETERVFGYSRDQLIGQAVEILVPDSSHNQHQQDRAAFFHNPNKRTMGSGRYLHAVRSDGVKFPAEIGLQPIQFENELFVLSTIFDLTHQKKEEDRIIHLAEELEEANRRLGQLAVTDRLTEIFNRRALDEQLEKQIQLMHRIGRPISFLMLDIDNFKPFNDHFGHSSGDEVLKSVAGLLRQNARATDLVARYGGDEFSVVMPDTNEEGALLMARRFKTAIRNFAWEQAGITVSMGISTLVFGKGTSGRMIDYSAKLLEESDRALYISKNGGRNRVTHISEILNTEQT